MRYIASCKQRSNSKEMLEHNKIGPNCNSSHPGWKSSAAPAARPRSRPLSVSRVTPIPLSIPGATSAPPAPLPAPAPGPRPAPASTSSAVAGTTATPATSSPETSPIRPRPASIDSDPQVASIVGPPVELVHGVLTSRHLSHHLFQGLQPSASSFQAFSLDQHFRLCFQPLGADSARLRLPANLITVKLSLSVTAVCYK